MFAEKILETFFPFHGNAPNFPVCEACQSLPGEVRGPSLKVSVIPEYFHVTMVPSGLTYLYLRVQNIHALLGHLVLAVHRREHTARACCM